MGEEGLEPPTDYLEGSCSIQLSYSPVLAPYSIILSRQLQQLRLDFSEQVQIDCPHAIVQIGAIQKIGNITLGDSSIHSIKYYYTSDRTDIWTMPDRKRQSSMHHW